MNQNTAPAERGGITRRILVKGTALAAAAALTGELFPDFGFVTEADAAETAKNEIVYSGCKQCAQPQCCGMYEFKDGVLVGCEGNPEYPTNEGALCSRGQGFPLNYYNPYRIKKPLKRTNPEKGIDVDPQWEEITWDEAYTIIADKLKEIRAADPRRFCLMNGFARSASLIEGYDFVKAFGCENYVEVDGPTCSLHFGPSLMLGNFEMGNGYPEPLFNNYHVLLGGGNSAASGYAAKSHEWQFVQERGARGVSVDPRCNIEGAKHEWLPIKPGTDLAFVLGLMNCILYELEYDVDFIKKRSNGPYLIGPDKHYVRDPRSNKPLVWDSTTDTAKTFDDESIGDYEIFGTYEVDGASCSTGFQLFYDAMKRYTPEWQEAISTVPASRLREIAGTLVREACIGQTIKLEGVEMPYRPSLLGFERGACTQFYGGTFHCACIIVNELLGCVDVPGGALGRTGPTFGLKGSPTNVASSPDADGVLEPKVEARFRELHFPPDRMDSKDCFYPYAHDSPHYLMDAILNPDRYSLDYNLDALFVWGGNPVTRVFSQKKALDALCAVPFLFNLNFSVDEVATLSDIVLPEGHNLERWFATGMRKGCRKDPERGNILRNAPLVMQDVKHLHDSVDPAEFFIELAERVGILYGEDGMLAWTQREGYSAVTYKDEFKPDVNTRPTAKDLANLTLKSNWGADMDVDAFRNDPLPTYKEPPLHTNYPYFFHPETRYQIYLEGLLTRGEVLRDFLEEHDAQIPGWEGYDSWMEFYDPVVGWHEKRPELIAPDEYDLCIFNWKSPQFSFGSGGNMENPRLHQVAEETDPYYRKFAINPATAREKGLREGDAVSVVPFDTGIELTGSLTLSEMIHPESLGIAGIDGHLSPHMASVALGGIHYNSCQGDDPDRWDPISGGFDGSHMVRITSIG